MPYSATSAALKAFEESNGYKIPKADTAVRKAGQAALYGGRHEVYFKGDTRSEAFKRANPGHLYYFDFTAQYANVMAGQPFPDFCEWTRSTKPTGPCYITEARIRVRDVTGICPVPYHLKLKKADREILVYPSGEFEGSFTSVDLDYKGVDVIRHKRTINFPNVSFNFRGFIEQFIPHNDAEISKAIKKNIYTSLSGKFAQGDSQTMLVKNDPDKLKDSDYVTGTFFGDYVLVDRATPFPRFSNFVWTAFINAYGRRNLWRLFEAIHEQGGKILYTNTDSALCLFTHAYNARKVISNFSSAIRFKELDWAKVLSPKCYLYADKSGLVEVVASGIPAKLRDEIAAGSTEDLFAEIPDTFFQALKYGAVAREIKNAWRTRKFSMAQDRSLGRLPGKGGWTLPLVLPLNLRGAR